MALWRRSTPLLGAMPLRCILALCLAVGGVSGGLPENQFETLSYDSIVDRLHDLAANYPHLAQVWHDGRGTTRSYHSSNSSFTRFNEDWNAADRAAYLVEPS